MLMLMAIALQKKSVWQYCLASLNDNPTSILLKFTYLFLQLLDLGLTLLATSIGLIELNPFINGILDSPLKLLMMKFFIPLLIARLVPGKLLIPGILLLLFIVTWNIQELLSFVFK